MNSPLFSPYPEQGGGNPRISVDTYILARKRGVLTLATTPKNTFSMRCTRKSQYSLVFSLLLITTIMFLICP